MQNKLFEPLNSVPRLVRKSLLVVALLLVSAQSWAVITFSASPLTLQPGQSGQVTISAVQDIPSGCLGDCPPVPQPGRVVGEVALVSGTSNDSARLSLLCPTTVVRTSGAQCQLIACSAPGVAGGCCLRFEAAATSGELFAGCDVRYTASPLVAVGNYRHELFGNCFEGSTSVICQVGSNRLTVTGAAGASVTTNTPPGPFTLAVGQSQEFRFDYNFDSGLIQRIATFVANPLGVTAQVALGENCETKPNALLLFEELANSVGDNTSTRRFRITGCGRMGTWSLSPVGATSSVNNGCPSPLPSNFVSTPTCTRLVGTPVTFTLLPAPVSITTNPAPGPLTYTGNGTPATAREIQISVTSQATVNCELRPAANGIGAFSQVPLTRSLTSANGTLRYQLNHCIPQAAASTAEVFCREGAINGTGQSYSWPLTCPAISTFPAPVADTRLCRTESAPADLAQFSVTSISPDGRYITYIRADANNTRIDPRLFENRVQEVAVFDRIEQRITQLTTNSEQTFDTARWSDNGNLRLESNAFVTFPIVNDRQIRQGIGRNLPVLQVAGFPNPVAVSGVQRSIPSGLTIDSGSADGNKLLLRSQNGAASLLDVRTSQLLDVDH